MATPLLTIEPNGVYDDALIRSALDVGAKTLDEARRSGRLRFAREGRRVFYLGQWVIDWLSNSAGKLGGPHHGP
jgi:hypothetical protein